MACRSPPSAFEYYPAFPCFCSSLQRNSNGSASWPPAPVSDRHVSSTLASSLLCQRMQTSQGASLMAMANQSLPLALISQDASQKLDLLAATASSSSVACAEASMETLYRLIEEVKERERGKAVQEIIYALVVSKMLNAMLARPQERTSHLDPMLAVSELLLSQEDSRMAQQLGLDDRLQAVHASEVQRFTARHVAMVLYGKGGARVPLEPNAHAHVVKFEMGKIYAASVMHGYFLARLHQRFQLDQMLLLKASSIGASLQRDHKAPSLEVYMEGAAFQDVGTLRQLSSISSIYTLEVIEHHCAALFGDNPVQVNNVNTNINIHLNFARSLLYQALAFGALLWDVEHNFAPLNPHLCNKQ